MPHRVSRAGSNYESVPSQEICAMNLKSGTLTGLAACPLLLAAIASAAPADTRLLDAVARQDGQAARTLLKQGADVKARAADGGTALQWAAHWDDVELAGLLLKAGANVDAADDHGVTPLALATENVSERMVETLLKAGANPNVARTS